MLDGMKNKGPKEWSVYVLECGDGSLYTGIAKDIQARLLCHQAGRGAAYTRTHLPVKLLYSETNLTRSEALIREAAVKRLPRAKKQILIQSRKKRRKGARMKNLTEKPETIVWPEMEYVYNERVGPFMETARLCWSDLHTAVPAISEHNKITGYMSLYKVKPEMIYRAGVSVASAPAQVPVGMSSFKFKGGNYARFVLKGSYAQLPEAVGRVFEIVEKTKLSLREDWFIENYVNDPRITPEERLLTHILIPIV